MIDKGVEAAAGLPLITGINNPTITPLHMGQLAITNLPGSPRHSRSSFTMPNEIQKSLRSLHSFKDIFVSRKRIAFGPVITEGANVYT